MVVNAVQDADGVVHPVKQPVVYILASEPYGTLYIGVTSNLAQRVRPLIGAVSVEGFTKQYAVRSLVYFEVHDDMYEAIQREKRLKKWNRKWKLRLIEEMNTRNGKTFLRRRSKAKRGPRLRGDDELGRIPKKELTGSPPSRDDNPG